MIRPSMIPGGFTRNFPTPKCEHVKRSRRGSASSAEIKEAADRVLEKRGCKMMPVDFRDNIAPYSSREKPVVGSLIGLPAAPHVNPAASLKGKL